MLVCGLSRLSQGTQHIKTVIACGPLGLLQVLNPFPHIQCDTVYILRDLKRTGQQFYSTASGYPSFQTFLPGVFLQLQNILQKHAN
jgi:hypothetical protein